jgi:trans-aconitate 2-methyltransferase
MWDAAQYLRYGDERARPFLDLIARVGAVAPSSVVDLGCGPGNLTALLAQRWPGAEVSGVDNSPEMIEAARAAAPGLRFETGDVRDWRPGRAPDVITCNAVLQWVPDHHDLVVSWADALAPGGWLAFQLPGNFSSPTYSLAAELAASPRWRALLKGAELNRQAGEPGDYVRLLARPGFQVDAWETTYQHILAPPGGTTPRTPRSVPDEEANISGAPGKDAVLEWTKGTMLRPILAVLGEGQAADFLAEYGERLRTAYPAEPFGTVFPFRRVFAVVHRGDSQC